MYFPALVQNFFHQVSECCSEQSEETRLQLHELFADLKCLGTVDIYKPGSNVLAMTNNSKELPFGHVSLKFSVTFVFDLHTLIYRNKD